MFWTVDPAWIQHFFVFRVHMLPESWTPKSGKPFDDAEQWSKPFINSSSSFISSRSEGIAPSDMPKNDDTDLTLSANNYTNIIFANYTL